MRILRTLFAVGLLGGLGCSDQNEGPRRDEQPRRNEPEHQPIQVKPGQGKEGSNWGTKPEK